MPSILFVEDDLPIREYYSDLLIDAGFEVTAAADSASALASYETSRPDLVLLDISLGSDSDAGFDLCMTLRTRSEILPIIFLTSHDSDFDKISGMRLGADDYITKDVNIDYLIVRIKALLKRISLLSKKLPTSPAEQLDLGDLSLNMDKLTASWKNKKLDLSLTQLWMLHALASHAGYVRTPEQLMKAASTVIELNTLTVHISNIRKSFETIDAEFSAIKTERGMGYRWITE